MGNNLGIKLNKQCADVIKKFRRYETKRTKEQNDNNLFYCDEDFEKILTADTEDNELSEKSCQIKSLFKKVKNSKTIPTACIFSLGVVTGIIVNSILNKDK